MCSLLTRKPSIDRLIANSRLGSSAGVRATVAAVALCSRCGLRLPASSSRSPARRGGHSNVAFAQRADFCPQSTSVTSSALLGRRSPQLRPFGNARSWTAWIAASILATPEPLPGVVPMPIRPLPPPLAVRTHRRASPWPNAFEACRQQDRHSTAKGRIQAARDDSAKQIAIQEWGVSAAVGLRLPQGTAHCRRGRCRRHAPARARLPAVRRRGATQRDM